MILLYKTERMMKDSMQKPFFELDEKTKSIILELLSTCKRIDLGNFNFVYYNSCSFNLVEFKSYWQLTVCTENRSNRSYYRDIYKITDKIIYDYSETD